MNRAIEIIESIEHAYHRYIFEDGIEPNLMELANPTSMIEAEAYEVYDWMKTKGEQILKDAETLQSRLKPKLTLIKQ